MTESSFKPRGFDPRSHSICILLVIEVVTILQSALCIYAKGSDFQATGALVKRPGELVRLLNRTDIWVNRTAAREPQLVAYLFSRSSFH